MGKIILIGIAGGTASGKTTLAMDIYNKLGESRVTVIKQDDYYKDRSMLSVEKIEKINFDAPKSFDTHLLIKHLKLLLDGKTIEKPIYCYQIHGRNDKTEKISPKEIIILEGILVLADSALCNLMDIKIYVDTPDDIRFIRRLVRDIKERGRTMDLVIKQYIDTVRAMHIKYTAPTKKFADIIVSGEKSEIGKVIKAINKITGKNNEEIRRNN
ncbi:uridine kinase [Candidatus Desantisbacteria bacterium]|nr:uridine kinase [Candidatus Desantisbacteria bacterium]